MLDIREYADEAGRIPFRRWANKLNMSAAAKVAAALQKLADGKISNVKGVGAGVFEFKIDFGPGYRVYFGKDGERVVILLGGGTKDSQADDIKTAHRYWDAYKQEKRR